MQERIDDANQTYEGDQPGLGQDGFGGAPGGFGADDWLQRIDLGLWSSIDKV